MSIPSLAITGATGHIGGLVANNLSTSGISQLLLARSPKDAPDLPGAITRQCNYENTEGSRTALTGVQTLFMVSATESHDRLEQHRSFIDAAVQAGVEHIVYLSFFGAAPDATFTLARDHWATERHILESGVEHTFLRDNLYTDFLPHMVGEDGVIRGPAGNGRVAAVTRADIARVAEVVLKEPSAHKGASYDLTGPEALSFAEIAQILAEVTGRNISFHNETVAEAYASRLRWQAPQWQYDAWVSTYTAVAAGELAWVSDQVRQLTGRCPESLRDFLDQTC